MLKFKRLFCLVLMSLLAGGFLFAQSDEEIYQGFQFNFFPPGARAMAMGGAFIGLADDATSTFSNPAGMVIISKPEISGEFKFTSYNTYRLSTWNSLTTGETTAFGESVASPSFASFVYPIGNISVGVSMSNFMNYEESFRLDARPIPGTNMAYNGGTGDLNFTAYNFSGSVAARLSDQISVGATLNYVTFNVQTNTTLRNVNWSNYADLSTALKNQAIVDDSDSGFGFTAGILFNPIPELSIGAMYSCYPTVEYLQEFYTYTASNQTVGFKQEDITIQMNIPDRFGVGFAFRPFDELVILADVLFMQYSQITETVISTYYWNDTYERGSDISAWYETDNTTEIHVGLEYALMLDKTPFFIRGGIFTNPYHRPTYVGPIAYEVQRWNFLDLERENISSTEIGFTFGLGTVIGGVFQIDGAYMISDSVNQGIISVVYHL